jgi:hypothetical protein
MIYLRVRLEQVSQRAGLEHAPDQDLLVVHGEDQDLGVRLAFSNLPSRLDSIQEWQRIVDHRDVRLGFERLFDGLLAIRGLCNNFPAGMRFEDRTQSRPHNLVIVGNKDPRHDRLSNRC